MTRLVDTGELVFPTEVDDELERFRRPGAEDPIGDWVAASKRRATRFGPQFDYVRTVMADPQTGRVVDSEKVGWTKQTHTCLHWLSRSGRRQM
jgi:hypothetical protein